MKRFWMAAGAALLLCACGGQTVHMPAPIGEWVKPGLSPWLTVTGAEDHLEVHGLDHKLVLEPSPHLSAAMQSQLGKQLQGSYFQDLVVTCSSLKTSLHVETDKSPYKLDMEFNLHCSIWARGFDANRDYQAEASTTMGAGAGDQAYAQALPKLLVDGARQVAGQMHIDLHKIGRSTH